MLTNPTLQAVNSSAAECGNKGIKMIRKSLSYQTEEHAILFTAAFIDVWNRERIRRLLKTRE